MAVTSLLDTLFRRRKKKHTDFISIFEYEFETIRAATHEFSYQIHHGWSSYIYYKGKLQSGQEIAVKSFSGRSITSERDFRNELEVLSKLRHKNLIHLLGFCSERDQHFLVYEFMPNSSLDQFILDPCRASQLSWEMCRNIVEGIARGLRYLHEESGLQVVHLNIQPHNILLDEDFQPRISGFDVARMIQNGENEAELTRLPGTMRCIDPKLHQTLRFSAKTDVYGFGVAILEIITRRSIYSWGEETLIEYVKRCWNRGEAINVIHEAIRKGEREDSISEILRYIHIALLCLDVNPETRPRIDQVLHWFSCFSTSLPEPTIVDRFLAEEETNWLLSPSPGYGSPMSPVSPR